MAAGDIGNWLNLIAFGGAEMQSTFTSGGTLNPSPLSQIVPFDTNNGDFTIGMSARAIRGQKVTFIDVGLNTAYESLTITDPNGYPFQDPDNDTQFTIGYVLTQSRNLTWVLCYAPNVFELNPGVMSPTLYTNHYFWAAQ